MSLPSSDTTTRSAGGRRTQAQRRAATVARLQNATIEVLAECGYSSTTTSEICRRAGVSQGALFRHFATRLEVVAAATDEIGRRHVERFEVAFAHGELPAMVSTIVSFIRTTVRSREHAAWHEVMVAARTDDALRAHVRPSLQRYEAALLATVPDHLGVTGARAQHLGMVLLSVMHLFDSEAVTVRVLDNPELEQARIVWLTELLTRELSAALG